MIRFEGVKSHLIHTDMSLKNLDLIYEGNTGQIKRCEVRKKKIKVGFYGPILDLDVQYIII